MRSSSASRLARSTMLRSSRTFPVIVGEERARGFVDYVRLARSHARQQRLGEQQYVVAALAQRRYGDAGKR